MSNPARAIRKGEAWTNAAGQEMTAPGDGAIIGCAFVPFEELVHVVRELVNGRE